MEVGGARGVFSIFASYYILRRSWISSRVQSVDRRLASLPMCCFCFRDAEGPIEGQRPRYVDG
jgi:hypothetical protein